MTDVMQQSRRHEAGRLTRPHGQVCGLQGVLQLIDVVQAITARGTRFKDLKEFLAKR